MSGGFRSCCWRRTTPSPTISTESEEIVRQEIKEMKPIIMDVCLSNITVEEKKNAILHCSLAKLPEEDFTVTWTKNGEVLQSNRKTKIKSNGRDHKLTITNTAEEDHGVYGIMIRQGDAMSFSKCLLFVNPAKPKLENGVIYLKPESRHSSGVLVQLVSTKVYVGEIIQLEACFKERKTQEFLWFKNNQLVMEDDRYTILTDNRTAILAIVNARETDSGIYHVVTKTRYGIDSTFADVLVMKLDPQVSLNSDITPVIHENFPRELEAYEGEEVRMVAKITFDSNTDFIWQKDLESLERKQNTEVIYYNNQFVSLKFNYVSMSDVGTYTLIACNVVKDTSTSTFCNLSVKELPKKKYLTNAKVIVPLNSAVAYVGSSVVYRCKFKVENPQYCCALWEVGPYQVERTNTKYCIFCNGMDFFLLIKKVEPDMSGVISCQVCKVIPRKKSYCLLKSTASLTIVPGIMTNDIANGLPIVPTRPWFYKTFMREFAPISEQKYIKVVEKKLVRKPTTSENGEKTSPKNMEETVKKDEVATLTRSSLSSDVASTSKTVHRKESPQSSNEYFECLGSDQNVDSLARQKTTKGNKAESLKRDSSNEGATSSTNDKNMMEEATSSMKECSLDVQVGSSSNTLHQRHTSSSSKDNFEGFSSNNVETSFLNRAMKTDTSSTLELCSSNSEDASCQDDEIPTSTDHFDSLKKGEAIPSYKTIKVETEPILNVNLFGNRIATSSATTVGDVPSTSKTYVELGKRLQTGTENMDDNYTLNIMIYKCDDDVFWMDVISKHPCEFGRVAVEEMLHEHYNQATDKTEWITVLQFDWQEVGNFWYSIDIYGVDQFIGSGVTSTPSFRLQELPYEMVLKFRIRAVKALSAIRKPVLISLEVNESDLESPRHITILPMSDYPTIFAETGEHLGYGAFGNVVLVQDIAGVSYAAKKIKTSMKKKRNIAFKEYELLNILEHHSLVRVFLAFYAKEKFTLIMEYLWGGDLLQRVRQEGRLRECDVIVYVRQICEALRYIHLHGIIHLDIKPANIICINPNSRVVKLVDFGLAHILQEKSKLRALYITRDYVPPEVLNYQPVSEACDMWSFGVLTYMLLSGVLPFTGDSMFDLIHSIMNVEYEYDHPAFRKVSDVSKDFIGRLLQREPENRMSAEQALEHAWLKDPQGGVRCTLTYEPRQNRRQYIAQQREQALWHGNSRMLQVANERHNTLLQTTTRTKFN